MTRKDFSYAGRKRAGHRAFVLWMPYALYKSLRMKAASEERSMSAVVQEALKRYLGVKG